MGLPQRQSERTGRQRRESVGRPRRHAGVARPISYHEARFLSNRRLLKGFSARRRSFPLDSADAAATIHDRKRQWACRRFGRPTEHTLVPGIASCGTCPSLAGQSKDTPMEPPPPGSQIIRRFLYAPIDRLRGHGASIPFSIRRSAYLMSRRCPCLAKVSSAMWYHLSGSA